MLVLERENIGCFMDRETRHIPVLSSEILEYLSLPSDGTFLDCTLGLGGHSRLIAENLGPSGRIIGLDQDQEALRMAEQNLHSYRDQCSFVHSNFRNVEQALNSLSVSTVDGILLDLGVSSYQLDAPERGFSLKEDGPLDMRMDQTKKITAQDLINTLPEKELERIIRTFGEERFAKRIAKYIVYQRSRSPLQTTSELRDVVYRAMPLGNRKYKIHPATRTFQAFRIVVNRELESLDAALEKCVELLSPGARICVISFHSLEDRIVKLAFRALAKEKIIKLVFKKPLRPTEEEMMVNPRARSARLRVGEKL